MRKIKFSLFKIAPVVALFAFVGMSAAKPQVNAIAKSGEKFLHTSANAEYIPLESTVAGWFDHTRIKELTGSELELTEFTLEYGMYFPADSGVDGILGYKIIDNRNINITCPYIVPKVWDKHYSIEKPKGNHNLVRYISYDEEGMCSEEDVWDCNGVETIYDNGAGQLNFKNAPTITGRREGSSLETLECTLLPKHTNPGIGTKLKGLQDLVITLPENKNIFDYSYIEVNFNDIKYQGEVYNDEKDFAIRGIYTNVDTSHPNYTLKIYPSTTVSGTKLNRNIAKTATWYEAARTSNSNGSFVDMEDATNRLVTAIYLNSYDTNGIYNNATYSQADGKFSFTAAHNSFQDYLGRNKNFADCPVIPGSEESFTDGETPEILIIPIYKEKAEDGLKHDIDHFVAFRKPASIAPTQKIEKAILDQISYLVVERNIFKNLNPADAWIGDGVVDPTGEHSPVFNDYEFYDSSFTVNNKNNSFKLATLAADQTSFSPETKSADTDVTVNAPNTFTTFEAGIYQSGGVGKVRNVFNAKNYSGSEWEKAIVPSGTDSFKGILNSLFSSSEITPKYYMLGVGETDNKITFNSADKMFVRITKDGKDVTNLIASKTYSFSETNLATVANSESPSYSINSEGEYIFEVFNRTDSKVTSRTLYVSEEAKFATSLPQVSNTDLKISYAVPDNVSFTSITLKKGTSTSHQTEPSFQEEVSSEPSGFTSISKDDDGLDISTENDTYHFTQSGKDFHAVYYLELVTSLKTKKYLIYWNYQWADYSLTVNPSGNGTITGNEPTYTEDSYTNIQITPATGNKIVSIKWNNEEETISDPTATFTLKKQMTQNSILDVVFDSIVFHNLTFSYDNTKGTITGDEKSYSEFEEVEITLTALTGNYIKSIMWNDESITVTDPSTMTFKHKLTEATTLTVNFAVIKTKYSFTVTSDGEGTLEGTPTGSYDEGDQVSVTAKASEGHEISHIIWNDEIIPVTNPSEMTITRVISKDTELIITFSVILPRYTITYQEASGGTVTNIEANYVEGSQTEIHITPNEHYFINSIKWNGKGISISDEEKKNGYILKEAMTQNSTLEVEFKAEPQPTDNTPIIVGVCCGVGAVAVGIGTFLIIRAKKVGSMKK